MVVVDSDILIWMLRGDTHITGKFKNAVIETNGGIFITPVQIAEIYAGIFPEEEAAVESFFSSLAVIAIDEKIGKLAGEFMNRYARSHKVTLSDAMVASASRLSGCKLWTRNRKHYPMFGSDEFFER